MLVVKALYGLRSSGAAFRALLAETLKMRYKPSYADADVWLRPAVRPDGFEYYELILTYVDDLLCISHDPQKSMFGIKDDFKLKHDLIAAPDVYLGASLERMKLADGKWCWTMSPNKYIDSAVSNVEQMLEKEGKRLPGKCVNPFSCNYSPWLETSPELNADGIQRYQELIGVLLHWAVEIERVDILLETSLLSFYLAIPRAEYLEQAYHIFGFLKQASKRKLGFDPGQPIIDERRFNNTTEWRPFKGTCHRLEAIACPLTVLWMRTTLAIKKCADPKAGSYCSATRRPLSGTASDKIQWKLQRFDRSLLL